MKIKISFASLLTLTLTLTLFTAVYSQTLDRAKLDQFFDRLAEKNKAMGSLTITKDGAVLYTRAIPLEATGQDKFKSDAARLVLEFDAAKNQMTIKRGGVERGFTKENKPL